MATIIFLVFGVLLLLAVLHTLRRVTSPAVLKGLVIVLPIAFCVAMGVSFIAPHKVAGFYSVFLNQHRIYPYQLVVGATVIVGIVMPALLATIYRNALRDRLGVHPVTLMVGMVVMIIVAALPGWHTHSIFPDMLAPVRFNAADNQLTRLIAAVEPGSLPAAAILVLATFAVFGAMMMTHHLLGPVFAVMSLGIALSAFLNENVSVIDHRAFFEFLDAAGLKGEILHYVVLLVSVVWGLHDIIFHPSEAFRFGKAVEKVKAEVTARVDGSA